jgi:transcriptional regulator with XRE-family HTH domain
VPRIPRGAFISCHVTLRGRKSRPGYPEHPRSLGEHLVKARMDRHLRRGEVARAIGCSKSGLRNWEQGRAEPEIRFLPAILALLGYDPRPEPEGFGGRLKRAREAEGLSQEALARRLQVDESTIWRVEKLGCLPARTSRAARAIEDYLGPEPGKSA